MSSDKLPQSVTVKKLVDSGASLTGSVNPDRLPRLAEAVVDISSAFDVQMDFGKREDYKSKIDVQIDGAVDMQCQRCLQSVSAPIYVSTTLIVVAHDEEAKSRIRDCEPIVLEEGMLDIDSMIEEEVLLALPLIAMHDTACNEMLDPADQRRTSIDLNRETNLNQETNLDQDRSLDKPQHADAAAEKELQSNTLVNDKVNTGSSGNADINKPLDKIDRRSDLGMDNPFDVLKTLKTGVGQEH